MKGKNKSFIIALLFLVIVGLTGYIIYYLNEEEDRPYEDRYAIADELLTKNCNALADISTEFINKDLIADLLNALAMNRCDCVKEILVPKMAEKYSYSEITKFRDKPIQEIIEVKNLIKENKNEINDCFRIKFRNK